MKIDKSIADLIFKMEYIIGSECYNPNSYDGYTGNEGCSFRYPVYIYADSKDSIQQKYKGRITDTSISQIETMKYKFGSNHLLIGNGLVNILNMLEERYNINFNDLEKSRK